LVTLHATDAVQLKQNDNSHVLHVFLFYFYYVTNTCADSIGHKRHVSTSLLQMAEHEQGGGEGNVNRKTANILFLTWLLF